MLTKRAFDLAVAGAALLLLLPLTVVVALTVFLVMGRPVLFRQSRAGWNGVEFPLLKFRTMRAPLGPDREYDDDEVRVTRLGRVLRSSSLDELPSLLNVLRGQMSLVGPRPLPLHYTPLYSPRQRRRLDVRPGVTGLAQVSGRNALPWEHRLELDVRYVETRSLRLDVAILARTVRQVARRDGVAMDGYLSCPQFRGTELAGSDRYAGK